MKKHLFARGIVGIAALPLFLVVSPTIGVAQDRSATVTGQRLDEMTERVSYRDLNLAFKPDEKILFRRVGFAVRRICDRLHEGVSPASYESMACSRGAWLGARPQIKTAVQRAREIALTGTSSLAAAAITISFK